MLVLAPWLKDGPVAVGVAIADVAVFELMSSDRAFRVQGEGGKSDPNS
jgi:hypothetical protein